MSFDVRVDENYEYKDPSAGLPDGVYRMVVEKTELKTSPKSTEPYLNIQLSVTEGKRQNQKAWLMVFKQHKNQAWADGTVEMLKSLTKETGAMSAGEKGENLIGREVMVGIKKEQIRKFSKAGAPDFSDIDDSVPF